MEHSQMILNVIAKKGISAYKLAKETGISESLFSKWKKNPTSEISSFNLTRIANYLNCSVDYLLGRTEQPSSTLNNIEGNVTGSAVVQGSHNGNVTVTNGASALTEEETELLRLFQSLDVKRRVKILNFCYSLEEEEAATG